MSLLDAQGNVAADSAFAYDLVPSQLEQPEVRAALAGAEERARRVDPLSGEPTLYAAAVVRQEGRIIGVVQVSRPEAAVTAQIRPLLLTLGLIGLAALAVASTLGIGLGRQLVKPVRDLERASLAMAAGDLDQQVPVLGRLAGALLDLSRPDEGRRRPPASELADIRPVLLDVAQMMALQAEQAGLALAADVPAALPPLPVRADDLEAILVNLLDNAVKYTPAPGRVALIVEAAAGRCRIIVSDTGPGILPEDLPHIFERFYRADKARSRNVGASGQGSGAGLGLSIVQALVQQNGGQICVDSSPGQGTRFIVDFPLAPQA